MFSVRDEHMLSVVYFFGKPLTFEGHLDLKLIPDQHHHLRDWHNSFRNSTCFQNRSNKYKRGRDLRNIKTSSGHHIRSKLQQCQTPEPHSGQLGTHDTQPNSIMVGAWGLRVGWFLATLFVSYSPPPKAKQNPWTFWLEMSDCPDVVMITMLCLSTFLQSLLSDFRF